jgi:hypothetical protein
MSVLTPLNSLTAPRFGARVDRAAGTLPATTAIALFTVSGGRVAITQIVGEVTTAIQNQANNTKLTSAATTGTAVDICAVLNIAADEVGCLYGITGLNSDALIGLNAGAVPGQARDVIVPIGSINLDCAATNTGAIKWTLFYVPIDAGAVV